MTILISGGHLTPALALCDYLLSHHPEHTVVFVGRVYSQDKTKQKAHEYVEVSKRGILFLPLAAPRLVLGAKYLAQAWTMMRLSWSTMVAFWLLLRHRPDVFVSFGGYVAVPVAIAAKLQGIKVVTHEQTRAPGVANRFIARVADKIAVSFTDTAEYFPAKKVVMTGNPVRSELFARKPERPSWLPALLPNKPLLYVTGGNQGSQIINDVIAQALPHLTKQWFIIHQCGGKTATADYLQQLERAKHTLGSTGQMAYYPREWISTDELTWIYRHAAGVVSRAGANTLVELAVLGIPSVLVPLPFSHHQEQQRNAEWLSEQRGAILLPQKDFNPESLLHALTKMKTQRTKMRAELLSLKVPKNGDAQLWQVIAELTGQVAGTHSTK